MNIKQLLSKFARIRDFPRYAKELPNYLRGYAYAKTRWGSTIKVSFPEYRSIVEHGYITGHGEEAIFDYLNTHLSPKDIFFDIGANIGFYSLLGAHKGAQVFAFEPFPSTLQVLGENVQGDKHITICPVAVSDKKAKLKMEIGTFPGLNKVSDTGTTEVDAICLDDFGIVPTIMKIDVEGHEMSVFRGAKQLLMQHKPTIIAEVTDESRDYLISIGYTATLLGKINYLFTA